MSLIAKCDIPTGIAFLSVNGGLTALNKVEAEANDWLIAQNLKPKARPVNNGVDLTKRAMHMATVAKSGKRVRKALQPIQLGLGAKAGPEKMVMTAHAMMKTGHIVCTEGRW